MLSLFSEPFIKKFRFIHAKNVTELKIDLLKKRQKKKPRIPTEQYFSSILILSWKLLQCLTSLVEKTLIQFFLFEFRKSDRVGKKKKKKKISKT